MVARASFSYVLLLAAACGLVGLTGAQSCVPQATVYTLLPASTFERGCFPPCLCPIQLGQALRGSFLLIEDLGSPASPFRDFEVSNVSWFVELAGQTVPITGFGHYRFGGEVALTQQLTLDLQVDNGPVEHFDSGVVADGIKFPAIDVRISVSGAVCFNTVLDVVAEPLAQAP